MMTRSLAVLLGLTAVLLAGMGEGRAAQPTVPKSGAPAASCSEYGPGFQAALGSSTCVRTGARVRAEGQVVSTKSRAASPTGSVAQGRVYLDARTPTELGPMRVYVRTGVSRSTGNGFDRP